MVGCFSSGKDFVVGVLFLFGGEKLRVSSLDIFVCFQTVMVVVGFG